MRSFGYIFLIMLLTGSSLQAQNRNSVWCFGDSALVDFSDTANIQTGKSAVKSRGSCVSICDSSGQLLLYAYTRAGVGDNTTLVKNNQDSLVLFGDSIVGEGWYRELVLLAFPQSDSLFILFSIGVTGSSEEGLYYSIIDISANGGSGAVIQKNVQVENFKMVDCLTAVKHGNGRDWWILYRRWNSSPITPNNEWYECLITPSGMSQLPIQLVGSIQSSGFGEIAFNSTGNKLSYSNYPGLIELYDFDRCTGILSNPLTIANENITAPWPAIWSAEFSPNGNLLYVERIAEDITDSSRLFQYDLNAPNIALSQQTIWTTPWHITIDQLKKGPDNKIYIATNYYQIYPYQDTMYNYINMNLSVINSPDSLGFACDLQTFSFSLGGARCYAALPNNPDYELGALLGSPCDSLTSISEVPAFSEAELFVYYASNWETAFINANKLKGEIYQLEVFDLLGKAILRESGKLNPPYFTKNLNCEGYSKGIYLVNLVTEKEKLSRKFIVQ